MIFVLICIALFLGLLGGGMHLSLAWALTMLAADVAWKLHNIQENTRRSADVLEQIKDRLLHQPPDKQ